MKEFVELFFMKWGVLNDGTWFGVFNLVIIPLFALGVVKRFWMSRWYRLLVLFVFACGIAASVIGLYYVSRPVA
ncbi:hypothetical protein BUE93_11230 [Chromobacterium amazonense]|uniref:Uncharacterized protein n=1 Tax=Chromobacterium amazonense TaxID=1382803 RepID=A0A2S9X571_9NEIS|nr:hypothetical protein [Chromobacterium amazonense]PRP70837.1 hypothetical protein BUE93_11230 [Chromobacterium amazonense]